MRQSQLFTKTRKTAPSDEIAKNAILLTRAGFIHKELAGVYSLLPLGLRTLENIKKIIREEMNAIGCQEMLMTALQDKTIWERTDRWDDAKIDNWFKTEFKSGGETGLGITHEEPLTRIMSGFVSSYRDLPVMAYQFQNKFRNEMRAKSGIMRGKEFLMKDAYSFSKNTDEHEKMHAQQREAYIKIFNRLGIGEVTYPTFASGGIFSPFSEEFQTISEAGEDTIYVHEEKKIAVNKEVYNDEALAKLGLSKEDLVEKKAIEVGNIFHLGTKFSEPLGLTYKDETGATQPVYMGCYGIGPTRIMGVLVEALSDEKGIVWPKAVAPFSVHLISIANGNADIAAEANRIYELLKDNNIEVLYDDREARAGEKFTDSELIGIPVRLIISEKTMQEGSFEIADRATGQKSMISESTLIQHLQK